MLHISERGKKILFISFFVIFTTGAGYALYYFFFLPKAQAPTEQTPGFGGSLQGSGERTNPPSTAQTGEGQGLGTTIAYGEGVNPNANVNLLRDSVTQSLSLNNGGTTR